MDLKIEIRNLDALHRATICLDHGVRDIKDSRGEWRSFAASRFVYAFFTFNSTYCFDWASSFEHKKPRWWRDPDGSKEPSQEDQIKAYLTCMDSLLQRETVELFQRTLNDQLRSSEIGDAVEELKDVQLVNAPKKLRNLAKQLPGQLKNLQTPNVAHEQFLPAACAVFKFIYLVRCNLFHGRKTQVQLLRPAQQKRLLIYCGALIAANSLLFEAVKRADIGWQEIQVDFLASPKD